MNTFYKINLLNLFLLVTYLIYTISLCSSQDEAHGVDYGDTPEIITSRGFGCETHSIVTSDGYILKVFRIVNPSESHDSNEIGPHGKPVILQSGLFGSSDDFLLNSPDGFYDESMLSLRHSYQTINYNQKGRNLAFLLANLGYDVWLTNFRGNYYSRNHTFLDPNSSEFWATGYDEMATIDLPEIIDHVLKETRKENVAYVGMSRGSGVGFAMLADRPEYSKKVKPFIAMAPAVFVRRSGQSLLRSFFELSMLSNYMVEHPSECFSRGFSKRMVSVCSNPMVDVVCSLIRQPFKLMLSDRVNASRLGVYFSHYPAGSPCWDIVHFTQVGATNRFQKIDLGSHRNQLRYGQPEPPIYPLDKIKSKDIVIISSVGDKIIHPDNVARLISHLTVKPKEWIEVKESYFSHGSFVHSQDAGEIVYKNIVRILSGYS